MKAYKGFNRDMTCRGFKFEEGKTYEEERAELCKTGFHACEAPIDCFGYYAPGQSVYREVELDATDERNSEDSKRVGKRIKIGAKLDIAGICKAQIEYVKSRCTNEYNAEPGKPAKAGDYGAATAGYRGAATAGSSGAAKAGDYGAATAGSSGAATAGYRGAATAGSSGAATAGYRGAATAGDFGAAKAGYRGAATAGDFGAATAGDYGAATAGYRGAATAGDSGAATAGDSGAATAGYRGAAKAGDYGAAKAGDYGAATSRGSSAVGKNGFACARGNGVKVKGGMGAILIIAEEKENEDDIEHWKAFVIDGETYKPDTWYRLDGDEIVEAEDGTASTD